MGGSGGTYNPSISKTGKNSNTIFQKSEDKAQRKLTDFHQRNVFISFDMKDESMIHLIRSQAKDERFSHDFRDYSVKERIEGKWQKKVRERISQSSAVLVAVGKNTHKSTAVDWEIREAHKQGKRIIGIKLHKNEKIIVPKAMKEYKCKIINWNTKRIARELE